MQAPSNPKSTDKLKIQPYFPSPSDLNNVIDPRSMFVPNNTIPSPDWKKEMKMKIPLPPPKYKSSSLILAPPANRRVTLTLYEAIEYELKHGRKLDPNMDRKKLRRPTLSISVFVPRKISNRLSARRSRMKRLQYINDMEKMVKDLQDTISVLTPQIESYEEKRTQLLLQNDSLQKLVEIRSSESKICEIELEQKRLEICRLKELAKTLNYNSHDSNSGPEQMQDLRFNHQLTSQPYSLEFYQNNLLKFGSNQFCQEQLASSALVQSERKMAPTFGFGQPDKDQQPGFMTEPPVEVLEPEKSHEEEDIDQYLNFEELNLNPACV